MMVPHLRQCRTMPGAFDEVLDPAVHALVRREVELLVTLREMLDEEQQDEHRRVDDLIRGLDELFTLVLVGEFNAGKSSVINALFGTKLRKEGPIPVDDRISILRWGEEPKTRNITPFVIEQTYPIDFLRTITLVDSPGTNSIVRQHQEITQDFIPRADLVLFVTSIDRPLSESERQFLEYIREWGKKVVFVLNKIDTKTGEEVDEVIAWIRENVEGIFGFEPTIYPVAARLALEAKMGDLPPREWTRSRFEAFEDYIHGKLSEKERIRLKLEAPLETVASLSLRQKDRIAERRNLLEADRIRIEALVDRIESARTELQQNFSQFTERLDNRMLELERRGVDFLDRYVRLGHIRLLRDPLKFREEFERQVFHDWAGSVDRTVQESVDWLVKNNMRLWNETVGASLGDPRNLAAQSEDLVGRVGREFAYNRDEVYARMRGEAERRLASYDISFESRKTIDAATSAVIQSLGLGAGAVGLGYLVTTAFSSTALDVTGLTAATMLLVTSFLILPYRRSKAKVEFRQRIEQVRSSLREALDRESSDEIDRMITDIRAAFDPWKRFHERESGRVERFSRSLDGIDSELATLQQQIKSLASDQR